jgi:outer membrane autotransporter protein
MHKLTLVALLSTISFSAFAAEPCKPYVSVNAGYSWGFNGKSTYTSYNNFAGSSSPTFTRSLGKQPKGMTASFIAGYAFNDAMRTEVGFDWNPKMKSTLNFFNVETQELGGHATVAYDFNNNTAVTPFLFGSLGFVSAEATIKASNRADSSTLNTGFPSSATFLLQAAPAGVVAAADIVSKKSGRKTLMTYKVGMGLAMKAGQGVDLEVKYGLGGKTQDWTPITDLAVSGVAATAAGGTYVAKSLTVKQMMDHSLTAGVRFTF